MTMTTAFTTAISLRHRPRYASKTCHSSSKVVLHHPQRATPAQPDSLTTTLNTLRSSPVLLCIRMKDVDLAIRAATAAIEGGLRCVEVAMTTPGSADIIKALCTNHPHALIGAGTVLTPIDVATAQHAGALFALSPITDPSIIASCHEVGMLAVPGAATPTECWNAYTAGAKLVKVFPINLYGGIDFVKAMQGPLGHIPLLPTSGIDATTLPSYLSAPNVYAVGASREILPREALENGEWEVITARARKWATIAATYGEAT